jgi:hypothetical protein
MSAELDRPRAPGALYVKRPTEVVRNEKLCTEILTAGAHERWALRSAAVNMQRRGEVKILHLEVWHEELRQWHLVVRRLKPPAPAWRKPVLIGAGAASLLGLLVATGWWALATLAVIPGAVALTTLGVAFLIWTVARTPGRPRRGGSVEVDVKVRVR